MGFGKALVHHDRLCVQSALHANVASGTKAQVSAVKMVNMFAGEDTEGEFEACLLILDIFSTTAGIAWHNNSLPDPLSLSIYILVICDPLVYCILVTLYNKNKKN